MKVNERLERLSRKLTASFINFAEEDNSVKKKLRFSLKFLVINFHILFNM